MGLFDFFKKRNSSKEDYSYNDLINDLENSLSTNLDIFEKSKFIKNIKDNYINTNTYFNLKIDDKLNILRVLEIDLQNGINIDDNYINNIRNHILDKTKFEDKQKIFNFLVNSKIKTVSMLYKPILFDILDDKDFLNNNDFTKTFKNANDDIKILILYKLSKNNITDSNILNSLDNNEKIALLDNMITIYNDNNSDYFYNTDLYKSINNLIKNSDFELTVNNEYFITNIMNKIVKNKNNFFINMFINKILQDNSKEVAEKYFEDNFKTVWKQYEPYDFDDEKSNNLENWDISNIVDASAMFNVDSKITNISLKGWDISNVLDVLDPRNVDKLGSETLVMIQGQYRDFKLDPESWVEKYSEMEKNKDYKTQLSMIAYLSVQDKSYKNRVNKLIDSKDKDIDQKEDINEEDNNIDNNLIDM